MERLPDPMNLLRAGLPLTLLIDLLDETGPRSDKILRCEPADLTWTRTTDAA